MSEAGEAVLVSGGAGGIGAAVCAQLAAAGYHPIVGYHAHRDAAEQIAQSCGGTPLALDLTDLAQVHAAVEAVAALPTSLAGVILAASPPPRPAPFGTITPEELTHQLAVNVVGPQQLLAGLVRRCFRQTRRGRVVGVLTSGMGSGIGSAAPNLGAYLIAKHGLAGVLATLAADYPWLTVDQVSPGFTETPMLQAFEARYLDAMRSQHAFASPGDVAAQIVATLLR